MKHVFIVITCLHLVWGMICFAQSNSTAFRGGIGVQISTPIIGVSALYKIVPEFGVEGILGFVSTLKFYGVKGNYYFNPEKSISPYVFGMLGNANYTILGETESILTFGIGGGAEYRSNNWGLSTDIGYGSFKFTKIDISVSSILVGVGLHYYCF